jgi:hypothetical protein
MESGGPTIEPWTEIRAGFSLLVRPPFVTILLIEIFLGVVAASMWELMGPDPEPELEFLGAVAPVFFLAATIYLQIAMILAAGGHAERSAEAWVRAALRHRCFWRFLGTSFIAVILILVAPIALVVKGLVAVTSVALAQSAVVLERTRPGESFRRGAELAEPARKAVAIMFAVLYLPSLVVGTMFLLFEIDLDLPLQLAADVGTSLLAGAATVALTRVFVKLGGAPTPPVQTLLYKQRAGSSR